MVCPKCEREYGWDVMVCPDCDVDTLDELPREGPEPTPDAQLTPVFATGDLGLIAIAKSLLDGEKIDFLIRGEGLQDLFGLGRATGYNYAMGPAEFWVREEDADNARTLLQDLRASGERRL
jgi:putative signal transducing protein